MSFAIPRPSTRRRVREANDCHEPGGKSTGGQFCAKRGTVTFQAHGVGTYTVHGPDGTEIGRLDVAEDGRGDHVSNVRIDKAWRQQGIASKLYDYVERDRGRPLKPSPTHQSPEAQALWASRAAAVWKSAGEQAAAEGRIHDAKPAAFKEALARNSRADTLSMYDEATLATFQLRMLDGGDAGYAIKPDGEFVNLFNSGGAATRGAGPWLVIDAIEHGARHGDHFDGYLTAFYQRLGWTETRREANWTPGGPDVVFMRFTGDPKKAREQYRQNGRVV